VVTKILIFQNKCNKQSLARKELGTLTLADVHRQIHSLPGNAAISRNFLQQKNARAFTKSFAKIECGFEVGNV
jgi:hypothetical protein